MIFWSILTGFKNLSGLKKDHTRSGSFRIVAAMQINLCSTLLNEYKVTFFVNFEIQRKLSMRPYDNRI